METEVESMVTFFIHQASSSVPLLSTPVIDLTPPKPVSPTLQGLIFKAIIATTTTLLLPPPPQQQISSDPDLVSRVSTLEQVSTKQSMKLLKKLFKQLFKPYSTSSAWMTTDITDAPSSSSKQNTTSQSEQPVEDVPILDDVHISDSEDIGVAPLPKIKTRPDWLKPVPEEDRPENPEPDWIVPPNDLPEPKNNWANAFATSYKDPEENKLLQKTGDISSFIKWYCRQIGKSKLCKVDLEGPAYKGHRVVLDMSKPLPLGGPPSQVTIQPQFFFNKDLEYLMSNNKERRSALSISKLKAANYPEFGLEELVPSLWIESEREYDVSAAYGISYWWFKQKEFYITKHSAHSDRRAVRDNYNEYNILEFDFKKLHPNDFEDMYLLHLQGKLNHLSGYDKVNLFNAVNLWIRNIIIRKCVEDLQLGIESYQTKLKLTEPSWDAIDFLFKEDYTIVSMPRAVIYKNKNDYKKMMRETEVHKFSDGTLIRILEKLDHMVKDFKLFKYNPGMEKRIWSEDNRRRSKDFMEVIERRLKIRRIFRSLKSFVSGRLRYVDYRLIQQTE
ncbi:hypothetical protein Tco_0636019 [Tanacetum coccineum]